MNRKRENKILVDNALAVLVALEYYPRRLEICCYRARQRWLRYLINGGPEWEEREPHHFNSSLFAVNSFLLKSANGGPTIGAL
jgi:hypothetical protein